jgi:competence protein ComEC
MALPVSMTIILAAPFSATLTAWLIKLSAILIEISLFIVEYFASISWASTYVVTPNMPEIIAYFLLLFILFALLDHWTRKRHDPPSGSETFLRRGRMLTGALAGLIFLLFGYTLHGHLIETQNRDLRITAIDVGQGSSTLVRFPGGKKMLIDGGGSFNDDFDIGRHVVAPFLWQQKIRRIDVVLLTHVHPDHLNGLKFIVENFDVGEVWSNGHESNTESYQMFKNIIMERNLPRRVVSAVSLPVQIGGVHVRILNPVVPASKSDDMDNFDETNNLSVATELTYGDVGILLPADISEPTEARLIDQGVKIKSDVLFVPHHGGLTSSTEPFLDNIRPRVAIVSCGKDNVFRLPHPDVLDRYDARNIRLMRTDQDGAITISTDGRDLRIHSARDRR